MQGRHFRPSSAATELRTRALTDNSALDTVRPRTPTLPDGLGAGISSGGSRGMNRIVLDDPAGRLLVLEISIITYGSYGARQ